MPFCKQRICKLVFPQLDHFPPSYDTVHQPSYAVSTAAASPTASPQRVPSGAVLYISPAGLTNLGSVVTIVVANKVVMSTYKFSFPVCLTWFHSIVTALGMMAMAAAGIFQVRAAPIFFTDRFLTYDDTAAACMHVYPLYAQQAYSNIPGLRQLEINLQLQLCRKWPWGHIVSFPRTPLGACVIQSDDSSCSWLGTVQFAHSCKLLRLSQYRRHTAASWLCSSALHAC
jgi:hypothetical protein